MKVEDIYPADPQKRDIEKIDVEKEHERALLENQKNFAKLAAESTDDKERQLYEKVYAISQKVSEKGGLALVVGGFARDSVMRTIGYGLVPKDVDIEVYGVEKDILKELLSEFGKAEDVGEAFQVFKIGDIEVSIPRRDSKIGEGHKGFRAEADPKMLLAEAAKRRDLTINALALDPLTGEVIDPHGGIQDILDRKLRATDPEKFIEDPLRVLRVMQFAGRFNFDVDNETKEICRKLVKTKEFDNLSIERFEQEWNKLLLKSEKPSKGLEVARELEIIDRYPELKALIGCPQEYEWHPEGDVWTHTLMVLDEAKKITKREGLNDKESLILLLAALCHDFGKPLTTTIQEKNGKSRITAHGHEEAGVEPAKKFLQSIHMKIELVNEISPLIAAHLVPTKYNSEEFGDTAVRRLAKRLAPATIKSLVLLGEADAHGRGYWDDQPNAIVEARAWDNYPAGRALLAHAERLSDISATSSKTIQYIGGKKLIELGLNKNLGKKFGEILKELDKAQEEDKITGPEDLRLAKLFVAMHKASEDKSLNEENLLTGESLSVEEMIREVIDRFLEIGTHDMGTLVITLLLTRQALPPVLERNKAAILTAHKHGPAWFKHFEKGFYDDSWKSFYGEFEVNLQRQKELAELDFEEQLRIGLELIEHPDQKSIDTYKESFDIQPVEHSGMFAYYVTDSYPFETGMMEGFEVMVQYIPEKKRLCISVMDESPERVSEIDKKIRENLPEFRNAKKTGYLFASNEEGNDNVFTEADGKRVYDQIVEILKENN